MIRSYRPEDTEAILSVWEAATALAHPFLSEDFLASERHNIPNLYLPNAETWVWEDRGRVLGFIAMLGNEIGAVFVDPASHRQGIGRALVDYVRELKGDLVVEVFEANSLGRAFYDGYGFRYESKYVHEPTGCTLLRLQLQALSRRVP